MDYALRLEQYEGPLEKLLQLIEERKLDVNQVSLSAVTDDFIKYLESLPAAEPALLADFLVIASRLMLIKSKSLLPELPLSEEEESDIRDLERRLELYKRLKATERHIAKLWRSGHHAASRPYLSHASSLPPVFHPGSGLNPEALAEAFSKVYEALQRIALETETMEEAVVSLEEKMRDIAERLRGLEAVSLHSLSGTRARAELVIIFIAVLHLAREGRVALAQSEQFSDIIVSGTGVA